MLLNKISGWVNHVFGSRRKARRAGKRKPVALSVENLETRMVPSGLTSNQRYVSQLFRDLLHREVDMAGLKFFTSALDHGTTQAQVVQGIQSSRECLTLEVKKLYRDLLHREADASGLNQCVLYLQQAGSTQGIKDFLVGSAEYFQRQGGGTNLGFIQALYRDGLGRGADPGGQALWSRALTNGMSRTKVADLVFSSPEWDLRQVRILYNSRLHRGADAQGLDAFVKALQHGASESQVTIVMLSSREYLSRI